MDASARHVVIVGGPEERDELLAIVLDDGEAIPLFDSMDEAQDFLDSIGDFGADWRAREVTPGELAELLAYQGEEVLYVALSPPPERLEGGMEVQVIEREIFESLLESQASAKEDEPEVEKRGFLRRLFGR